VKRLLTLRNITALTGMRGRDKSHAHEKDICKVQGDITVSILRKLVIFGFAPGSFRDAVS